MEDTKISLDNQSEDTLQKVKFGHWKTWVINESLLTELRNVVNILKVQNTEVLVLKGADLIQNVYTDIAEREMIDIDIFIQKKDADVLKKTLQELGYKQSLHWVSDKNTPLIQKLDFFAQDTTNKWFFAKIDKFPLCFEIHAELYPSGLLPFRVNENKIWERSYISNGCRFMSKEDLLIFLCFHFSVHHQLKGFKWLVDIEKVLKKYRNLDWDYIIKTCEKGGLKTAIYYPLFYAKKLFKAPVREKILKRLEPDLIRKRAISLFVNEASIYGKEEEINPLFLKMSSFILGNLLIGKDYEKYFKGVTDGEIYKTIIIYLTTPLFTDNSKDLIKIFLNASNGANSFKRYIKILNKKVAR